MRGRALGLSFGTSGCEMSITLCVMSHVGGMDRGSSSILGQNGQRHSGIYCLAIFATHSGDGKSDGLSESGPVIYQA